MSGLGEFDLSTFVCPFTNAILNEPVLADDGHTYSQHAILCWFKSLSERRLRIISPCTRECCKRKEISEHLVPNSDIAKSIEEYRKMRLKSVQEGLAGGKAAVGLDVTLAPKSLAELGAMFSLLDSLRQLLSETLRGWQIPNIVVVGQESSGKSSVLERLMMTPLLPRDENICTRLPIHVRLRRSDQPMPPMLEVYNTETETTEKGPYVIAAQYGNVDVSDEMRRILTEEQGSLRGVSSSRIIILHVKNPDVPFLDLVDMPGLVTVPSGDEPLDMATQTCALVKRHIQSERGANSLYLAVVKATIAPNLSDALGILHKSDLYKKTLGVFTFCDELGRKNARRLEQWVREQSDGQGAVALEPWGWVATTNAPPEDEQGNAVVYENNYVRLRAQAAAELSTFRNMQLGQLLDDGYASHGALVSRLNSMFLDHLKRTWAPKTLRMLFCEQSKLAYVNALLGMPPAHEADTSTQVKEAIAQEVERVLDSGVPTLVQQYVTSVLINMQRDIQGVVQKAIQDAFPAAWLHEEQSEIERHEEVCGIIPRLVVPVDSFHQIFEKPPDTYGPLVDLCTRALLDQGSDASFWVEGVRALFPVDELGEVGQKLVDNPPCLLAKRFPGLIDALVEEINGDLKAKTDSLIREAVSHRVRRFSEEVACVEGWRKTLASATNAVEIIVVEADSLSKLKNDIVLIFLRYKRIMLQELRSSVRDRLVGRVSLREICAEQRLEIISREQALHRAKEGISQLLGLTTEEERQEWEKAAETGWLPEDKDPSNANLQASDLSGIDLSGFDLKGADFSQANLQKVNFTSAKLQGARLPAWSSGLLEGVKLAGAEGWVPADKDLSNAKLQGADLSSCDLSGVNFSSADLRGANILKANLQSVNLANAKLHDARLPWKSGLLEGVKLSGAEGCVPANKDLSNAKLKGADLSKCDLSGADLTGADLREAKLEGTNLNDATLCAAILHAARGARPATLPVTSPSGALCTVLGVGKPVVFALTTPRALTLRRVIIYNEYGDGSYDKTHDLHQHCAKEMEVQTGPSATGPWTSVVKFTSRQTKLEQKFEVAPDAPLLAGFVQVLVHETYGRDALVKSITLEGEGWG